MRKKAKSDFKKNTAENDQTGLYRGIIFLFNYSRVDERGDGFFDVLKGGGMVDAVVFFNEVGGDVVKCLFLFESVPDVGGSLVEAD